MLEEFFGVKFLYAKFSALDGHTTVTFEEQSGKDKPFTIKVNQTGLWFENKLEKKITNMDELQDWARLVSKAWAEHVKLAPKITSTFSGH